MTYHNSPEHKAYKAEWARQWRANNREDANRKLREWRHANREKVNAQKKRHYAKHSEQVREYVSSRQWMNKCGLPKETMLALRSEECFYCGGPGGQIDHLTPRSKGGTHDLWNLVPACKTCNGRKQDLTLDEFYKKYPLILQ